MEPRISVVLTMWQDFPELRLCLLGLARQTLPRNAYEVLLVSMGGPTQHRVEGLNLAQVCVPRLSTYHEAWLKNVGIRRSLGQHVVVLSADCYPSPDLLATLLHKLDRPRPCVLYTCSRRSIPREVVEEWLHAAPRFAAVAQRVDGQHGDPSQPFSLLATRRSVWEELGGFDERFTRPANFDADLVHRASLVGEWHNLDPWDTWVAHLDHGAVPFDKAAGSTGQLLTLNKLAGITRANEGEYWGLAWPQHAEPGGA